MAKKTFHRLTTLEGNPQWIKCQGEQIVIEGYTFYFCKVEFRHLSRPQQTLIEERSGVSVGYGDIKQLAIDRFTDRLKTYGKEKYEQLVDESVKKYGCSPSYNNVSYMHGRTI
jgi:hypothetical protein